MSHSRIGKVFRSIFRIQPCFSAIKEHNSGGKTNIIISIASKNKPSAVFPTPNHGESSPNRPFSPCNLIATQCLSFATSCLPNPTTPPIRKPPAIITRPITSSSEEIRTTTADSSLSSISARSFLIPTHLDLVPLRARPVFVFVSPSGIISIIVITSYSSPVAISGRIEGSSMLRWTRLVSVTPRQFLPEQVLATMNAPEEQARTCISRSPIPPQL